MWQNDGKNRGSSCAGSSHWYWKAEARKCKQTEIGDATLQIAGRARGDWEEICLWFGKGKIPAKFCCREYFLKHLRIF